MAISSDLAGDIGGAMTFAMAWVEVLIEDACRDRDVLPDVLGLALMTHRAGLDILADPVRREVEPVRYAEIPVDSMLQLRLQLIAGVGGPPGMRLGPARKSTDVGGVAGTRGDGQV